MFIFAIVLLSHKFQRSIITFSTVFRKTKLTVPATTKLKILKVIAYV